MLSQKQLTPGSCMYVKILPKMYFILTPRVPLICKETANLLIAKLMKGGWRLLYCAVLQKYSFLIIFTLECVWGSDNFLFLFFCYISIFYEVFYFLLGIFY